MLSLIRDLPDHLRERARPAETVDSCRVEGDLVLYWMCTAMRWDENPALDVARLFSKELQKPLLIYQALSEFYDYASDRHHTFILEGVRDLQRQAREARLSYAFHLQTRRDRAPHLLNLAKRATVVVTEDMPVDPPRRFLKQLQTKSKRPIVLVDTSCVAPMELVGRGYTRAYQFRENTRHLYQQRISRPWPKEAISVLGFESSRLPFETIDLQRESIAHLVAKCQIDHAIGPVRDTRGGSAAGYDRWKRFRQEGLKKYANLRNDPLANGVSRMSAYLHYGMVSPFRLAREAAEVRNSGAEKYLDELLIWRELAYSFCRFTSDAESMAAIPEWARLTLEEHLQDQRPAIYSWETLARGETDDSLWNAAQKSLLRHGELHNNVRMTWGKAILQWTRTPQEALRIMIDLNHRYALDGRDPASYGGILWCLGQFDRPFQPPAPITGTVRSRPSSEHARRLDPAEFSQFVTRERTTTSRRVAVVGAGIAGAMAARTLADHGALVTVYLSDPVLDQQLPSVDSVLIKPQHQPSSFAARDHRFLRYARTWQSIGLVATMNNAQVMQTLQSDATRYVAVPSHHAICQHLLRGLSDRRRSKIERIERAGETLLLDCQNPVESAEFDRVVLASSIVHIGNRLPNLFTESKEYENTDRIDDTQGELLFDQSAGIVVCRDSNLCSNMEADFLCGMAAAGRILGSFDEHWTDIDERQPMLF